MLILSVITAIVVVNYYFNPKTPENGSQSLSERIRELDSPQIIGYNSYIAPKIQFTPTPTYGSLISCLIKYESSGNPKAYNPCDTDGKEKIGVLQFGRATFNEFCVKRYGLPDNIWSEWVQKTCADRMIREGYLYRWGTKDNCT